MKKNYWWFMVVIVFVAGLMISNMLSELLFELRATHRQADFKHYAFLIFSKTQKTF